MTCKRFQIPPQQSLNKVENFLQQKISNLNKSNRKLTRYYLDTLDWRLLTNEYYLRAEHHGEEEYILQLYKTDSESLITQFHSPELPTLSTTLGHSKLATLLTPLLEERALLPQIGLNITQQIFSLENESDKTTAQFFIENERLLYPKQEKSIALKTLSIHQFRGFESAFKLKDKHLLNQLSLTPLEQTPIEMWISHLGLNTELFLTPEVHLTPDMRTDIAAKTILKSFHHDINVNKEVVEKDIDPECLHEFRVAVRRTRSFLAQVPKIIPQHQLIRFKKQFAELGAVTTHQRDLDVMLLEFNDYLNMLPENQHIDLEPVRQFVQKQRNATFADVKKYLQSAKYKRFMESWGNFLSQEVPKHSSLGNATLPVEQVANKCIWKTYKKLMKQGRKITNESEDIELHDLRKTGKKLRYLIEFFSSLHPKKEIKQVIKTLKLLQNNLGEFQDLHVHQELISQIKNEMEQAKELTDNTAHAIEQLGKVLELKHYQCRQEFHDTFAKFSKPGHQAIFIKLYKS